MDEQTRRYNATLAAVIRIAELTIAGKGTPRKRRAEARARLAELLAVRATR